MQWVVHRSGIDGVRALIGHAEIDNTSVAANWRGTGSHTLHVVHAILDFTANDSAALRYVATQPSSVKVKQRSMVVYLVIVEMAQRPPTQWNSCFITHTTSLFGKCTMGEPSIPSNFARCTSLACK